MTYADSFLNIDLIPRNLQKIFDIIFERIGNTFSFER